jgi:hypothetical protein
MQHVGLIIGIIIVIAIIVVVALGVYYIYSKGFDLGEGATCRFDIECASGDCKGNWAGLKRGTCTAPPAPPGGSCTKDSDCASGLYCVGGKCTSPQPDGAACTENADCTSNLCVNGICTALSPPGAPCTSNSDCANNTCSRWGRGGSTLCCPTTATELYGGYHYCKDMPDLTPCWSDGMCASGDCRNGHCT